MSNLMLSISGCRGVLGETMTPEVAARFAGAFGAMLVERASGRMVTVVLGRDGRRGSEMVKSAAAAGLMGAGCRVIDLGVAMTPSTAVMTDAVGRGLQNPAGGGVACPDGSVAGMMVTASHNPQNWCGLKCLLAEGGEHGSAACAPPADLAGAIIARFERGDTGRASWSGVGAIETDESACEEHVDRVMEAMEMSGMCELPSSLGEGIKVTLDSVNASGVEGGRLFLESVGCDEILHLGSESTGIFPHPPEPTAENLTLPGGLCDAVRGAGCDSGFAQDPDADRLAIVDEKGRYIGEEYTLALGALALLEGTGARGSDRVLVTNLSTSRMLDDVAAAHGARVVRTPVGEAHVVAAMKRLAAEGKTVVCGGEGNGGLIWPRVTYVRDSLSSMAMILWLMSPGGGGRGRKRTVNELVQSLPRYAIEKRKVELTRRESAEAAVEKIAKGFASQRVDRQDGAWVDFVTGPRAGKAWLHVRASNTEPIMRLIAEAPSATEAQAILSEAEHVIGNGR
ncbi:phosphomannomutase [Phycisphaerales bacterium]|nr:phosphomannomutase [Phycisphaerales bacterium]